MNHETKIVLNTAGPAILFVAGAAWVIAWQLIFPITGILYLLGALK